MKKHTLFLQHGTQLPDGTYAGANEQIDYYLASEVEARIAGLVKLLGEQREFTHHVRSACADVAEGHPCHCGLSEIDRRVNDELVKALPF